MWEVIVCEYVDGSYGEEVRTAPCQSVTYHHNFMTEYLTLYC